MKLPIWFLIWGLLAAPAVAEHPVSVNAIGFVAFKYIDSDHNSCARRVEAGSVGAVEAMIESAVLDRDGMLNSNDYMSVRLAREANGY